MEVRLRAAQMGFASWTGPVGREEDVGESSKVMRHACVLEMKDNRRCLMDANHTRDSIIDCDGNVTHQENCPMT